MDDDMLSALKRQVRIEVLLDLARIADAGVEITAAGLRDMANTTEHLDEDALPEI